MERRSERAGGVTRRFLESQSARQLFFRRCNSLASAAALALASRSFAVSSACCFRSVTS